MRDLWLLGVIAVAQLVFAALLTVLLLVNRVRRRQLDARDRRHSARLADPMHAWMIGSGDAATVGDALAELAPERALEQVLLVGQLSVAAAQVDELATHLRDAAWMRELVARAQSRLWWRRLQAARALTIVGTPSDRATVAALLDDPHPAVQTAATDCLPRTADEALVARVLERLHLQATVVRLYQFDALKRVWRRAVPTILARLRDPSLSVHELEIVVNLVEAIGTPDLIAAALPAHAHPEPTVRIAVARTLKRYFHPDALAVATRLLGDDDWRVRGQAARALGALGIEDAVPALGAAMTDRSWWVRFRAGLALAQLGERGRAELRRAREQSDRFAAEMARMISGLSEGGLVELSEA